MASIIAHSKWSRLFNGSIKKYLGINITIEIKNYGTIKLELYADKAPKTVSNFAKLVNEGFYINCGENLYNNCHNFMIFIIITTWWQFY